MTTDSNKLFELFNTLRNERDAAARRASRHYRLLAGLCFEFTEAWEAGGCTDEGVAAHLDEDWPSNAANALALDAEALPMAA